MRLSSSHDAGGGGTGLLAPPVEVERPRSRRRRRRHPGGPPTPPSGPDDGFGGRGDGDGEEDPERPGDGIALGPGALGLTLVLVAVVTFFTVFVAAYFLMRSQAVAWPPPDFPGAPSGLWASTLLLALSSVALARAVPRPAVGPEALRDHRAHAARWVRVTLLLGTAFVGLQAELWREVFAWGTNAAGNAYGTAFFSLTFLHAVHVVGGIAYLLRVLRLTGAPRAAWRGPLRLGSVYWHFMGGVWIALFAVLTLST